MLCCAVLQRVAVVLNEFEEHESEALAEQHLVVKHFVFEFVNQYCALFYVVFWKRDLVQLRALLLWLLLTNAVRASVRPSAHTRPYPSFQVFFMSQVINVLAFE